MSESQPTYKRQRFLLAFIRQIDSSVSTTDLQKLVFLNTMEGQTNFYEFLPYKTGAYSYQLAEDIEILDRDGYVTVTDTLILATGDYKQDNLYNIAAGRGCDLIREAYRKYPYYTINSEIIDQIFGSEEASRFKSERQKYKQSEQTLFTIGYEGKSIEAFINTLITNGIKLVCDVRKNPLSRKFGFSKSKLEQITGTAGVEYVHMPELGIESEKRSPLNSKEDYMVLFTDYEKTLPNLELHIDRVYSLLQAKSRIALMCYEKEADMCHRHVVRDYIAQAHKIKSEDL